MVENSVYPEGIPKKKAFDRNIPDGFDFWRDVVDNMQSSIFR